MYMYDGTSGTSSKQIDNKSMYLHADAPNTNYMYM